MTKRDNRKFWTNLLVFAMMAQNTLLGVAATWASDQVSSVQTGWELAKNGQSNVVIVKDSDASEVEQFAADELKSYLDRILGVRLEITSRMDSDKVNLVLGTPGRSATVNSILNNLGVALTQTDPGYDGYLIKSVIYNSKKTILLTGYTARTVLYASYHLLETLGARFYGQKSQPFEEVIPFSPHLAVSESLNIKNVPSMKYRIVNNNNFYAKNAEQLEKVADWAAKNRFNVFELWLRSADEAYDKTILSKRGIEVWLGGHNWSQFIDTSKGAWYTKESNIQSFLANVLKYAKAHPDAKAIGIWQEDGLQGKIREADPYGKGQTWRFTEWNLYVTNRVAKLFEENSISARVLWMAYGEGNVAPNPDYIKPGPNVDVVYYNMMQNYKYALSDDENNVPVEWMADPGQWRRGQNSDYHPEPIPNENLSSGPIVRSWSQYLQAVGFTGNLVTVEHTNMSIGTWLPYPMLSYLQMGPWGLGGQGEKPALQKDIQYLKSLGFNGWVNCYEFPDTSHGVPAHSPSPYWYRYLAETLWDPAADREALDQDFYRQYYGTLSADMESYFAQVWTEIEADPHDKNGLEKLKVPLLNAITVMKATADATGNQTLISRVKEIYQWHINTLIPRRENHYYVANGILRKPTDVTLNQNAGSVSLGWNNPDNDSTLKPVVYQVERSTDLQSWTKVGETSERWRIPIRFVDMSAPDVDGTYYYRVRVSYGTGQKQTITEYTDPKSIVYKAVNAGRVISTGKPVSVSSSYEKDDWSETKLNDGDMNGPKGWQSAQSSTANKSEWAVIDLGSETSIASVAFLPESNAVGIPVRLKIEVSNDSGFSRATVVADYSRQDYSPAVTGSPEFRLHNFPAPAGLKGRYVRLNVNQMNLLWPGTYGVILTELMVLSKSGEIGKNK